MERRSESGGSEPPPDKTISAGDRIGRFEIIGPLGAGGMGEVYRARDPQLRREVAIKIQSEEFGSDPERQYRFEREARAAASLNHPNVIAVHDFGIHQGIAFLVTELLDGGTLRQRMGGRPLPARAAVDYAIQLFNGLAAGHERGIVHRDIKPENVFLTPDGRVKILDFGLAKRVGDGSSADSTAMLEGVPSAPIVGTLLYMAPEQAGGLRTDHRSDIFSAGVVLFEMLAGFAPFRRSTQAETQRAILHDEPPEIPDIAPELAAIVRRCLMKAPDDRYQNVRDALFDLQVLPPAALIAAPPGARSRPAFRSSVWIAALLAVVLAAAAGGYFAGQRKAPVAGAPQPHRMHRLTDFPGMEEFPSMSPDGRSVAFTAHVGGQRQVFVRLRAGGSPIQITKDPADHLLPRWSPDGNSLVYFSPGSPDEAHGDIWSVPALGGSPRRITDSIGGADISRNGELAYFQLRDGRVRLVVSLLDGSSQRVVAGLVPGYHLYPRWSPDGRWIAYQRGDGLRYDIFVISRDGGEPRRLTAQKNVIRGLAWLPDSKAIVYASSGGTTLPYLPPLALWQVSLVTGASRQLTASDVWYENPDVHANGLITAVRMKMDFEIWTFPFDGTPEENVRRATQVTHQTGQVLTPTAAPDGERIAYLWDSGGHGNLWVKSARNGELRQITFENDPDVAVGVPVWSPDGRSIAFVSSKGRTGFEFGIWLVDPNGGNLRNIVKQGLGHAWSPDSQWIYYAETSAGVLNKVRRSGGPPVRVRDEATRNVIGLHETTLYYTVEHVLLDGRPELEIRAAAPENGRSRAVARIAASRIPHWQIVNPALSPDGQWLAMPLTEGRTTDIWALAAKDGTWRRVTAFGDRATFIARRVSWSPDGRSIIAAVGEGDADVVLLDGLITETGR